MVAPLCTRPWRPPPRWCAWIPFVIGDEHRRPDALVEAARHGDRLALEELLRSQYDNVYRLCRRITGSDDDAADAAQESLILVARGIARFDGRSAFSTWVYRIATNASLDELRRRRRRPLPTDEVGDDPRQLGADPAGEVAERLDVDASLMRLPAPFRAALVLRDVVGLSYEEVAGVLEVPIGTVRSRIARGRALLADELRGDNPGTSQAAAGVEGSEP